MNPAKPGVLALRQDGDRVAALAAEIRDALSGDGAILVQPADIADFSGDRWDRVGRKSPALSRFGGRPGPTGSAHALRNLVGSLSEAEATPASLALLGSGLFGLGFTTRRRRRRAGRVVSRVLLGVEGAGQDRRLRP